MWVKIIVVELLSEGVHYIVSIVMVLLPMDTYMRQRQILKLGVFNLLHMSEWNTGYWNMVTFVTDPTNNIRDIYVGGVRIDSALSNSALLFRDYNTLKQFYLEQDSQVIIGAETDIIGVTNVLSKDVQMDELYIYYGALTSTQISNLHDSYRLSD